MHTAAATINDNATNHRWIKQQKIDDTADIVNRKTCTQRTQNT